MSAQPIQDQEISSSSEQQPTAKPPPKSAKIYKAISIPQTLRLLVKEAKEWIDEPQVDSKQTGILTSKESTSDLDGFSSFPVIFYEDSRRRNPTNNSLFTAMIEGHEEQVLLDTGSPRNLLSMSMTGNHNIDDNYTPKIRGIGKEEIQAIGKVTLTVELTLGGRTKSVDIDFVVITDTLDTPVIGLEGMEDFGIRSEHRAGKSNFEFFANSDRVFNMLDVLKAMEKVGTGPWRPQLFNALREIEEARKSK